jgi:hypothetical protein
MTDLLPPSGITDWKRRVVVPALLGCALYMAWMESRRYLEPAGADQALNAMIGHELVAGRKLYGDLWDQKPPGVYVAYAVADTLVGYGPRQLILMNVLGWTVSLLGLYQAGKILAGWRGGLWSAALWAVLVVQREWFSEPNAEVFMTAGMVWAFALVLQLLKSPGNGWACAFGAAVGFASLFKPTAFAPAGLLGLGYIFGTWRAGGNPWQAFRYMLVAAGVTLLIWAGCLAWFWNQGTLGDLYATVVTYNGHYSGSMWRNLFGLRKVDNKCYLLAILVSCGCIPFFLKAQLTAEQRTGWVALAGWACGSAIAIALTGHWYQHYFQLWMPIYALAGGAILTMNFSGPPLRQIAWRLALLATVFAPLVVEHYRFASLSHGSPTRPNARNMGVLVNEALHPEESVFAFGYLGYSSGVYFASGRRPPTGVVFDFPLQSGPLKERLEKRIRDDLERQPPDLVVLDTSSFSGGEKIQTRIAGKPSTWGEQLSGWLSERYVQRESPMPDTYLWFARKGSSLERRLSEKK